MRTLGIKQSCKTKATNLPKKLLKLPRKLPMQLLKTNERVGAIKLVRKRKWELVGDALNTASEADDK